MRNLYNYITSSLKEATLIADYNLKESPLALGRDVYEFVQQLADEQVKEAVLKGVRDWYKDNQSRRNVSTGTNINAVLHIVDRDNKILMSVIDELERIGVMGENGEFDTPNTWSLGGVSLGSCNVRFNVATYKQLGADNYKFSVENGTYGPSFKKSNYGNGYNHLPAEDMNVLRQKLYDCMNGTKYEILSLPGDKRNLNIPSFIALFTAQYDKRKLKDLLNELKEDRRLQNFADVKDATSKGIQAYYASKKPGDYVGD